MSMVQTLVAFWSQKITGSTLYNIERPLGDSPSSGGGQLYIQISGESVKDILEFLGEPYPQQGAPIRVAARAVGSPEQVQEIEIAEKSAGRLRIANQNRYRATRHPGWSPSLGFPSLSPVNCSTEAGNQLIDSLGGLHIFLARDEHGEIWAGYQTGSVTDPSLDPELRKILSGSHRGGVWFYKEPK